MSGTEELIAANRAIRDLLESGVEEQLRALPGVFHVSVGLKERAGEVTDRLCIRVYVREKKEPGTLPASQLVPREIAGVPTDVNVVPRIGFTADNSRYRPIKGAIQISNRIVDVNDAGTRTQISRGTLGCIAIDLTDRSIVLLSNWHVLMANRARVGDRVYQPAPTSIPPVSLLELPKRPEDDTDAIAKIVRSVISDKVDGAIARVDVSSWCRCCGIDYREEIVGLSVGGRPGSNFIVGRRAATGGMTVFKVGQSTGRTEGRVVDPSYPTFCIARGSTAHLFTGQIEIAPADPARPFSVGGDSGAAVVDIDNHIVGLLFASSRVIEVPETPEGEEPPPDPCAPHRPAPSGEEPPPRSFANHIADVCTALNIEIKFRIGSGTTAGERLERRVAVAAPTESEPVPAAYLRLRARLLRHAAGARVLAAAEAHREEIVNLVLHHRPVTRAWHHGRGPAFLATLLNTLRAGGEELPPPIGGVPGDMLLERMMGALKVHGSPELCEAVEEFGPALLEAVRGSAVLDDVLDKLEASAPTTA